MKLVIAALIYCGLLFIVAVLFALPTMLLWDWLMPAIFGLKPITLPQAWGLNVLTAIFFRGYRRDPQ